MLLQTIVVVLAMTVTVSRVTLEFTNEQDNKRGKTNPRIRTCGVTGLSFSQPYLTFYLQNLTIYETRER